MRIFLIKVAPSLPNKFFDKIFIMLSRKVFFLFFRDVPNMFHGEYIVCDKFHHFSTLVTLMTQSATLRDMRLGV